MKITEGCFFLISLISHVMKPTGTSSTMSQRKPSTPFDAQKSTMSSILSHVDVCSSP